MRIIFPFCEGTSRFIAQNVRFLLKICGSELRALTPAAGVITPAIRPQRRNNAALRRNNAALRRKNAALRRKNAAIFRVADIQKIYIRIKNHRYFHLSSRL